MAFDSVVQEGSVMAFDSVVQEGSAMAFDMLICHETLSPAACSQWVPMLGGCQHVERHWRHAVSGCRPPW